MENIVLLNNPERMNMRVLWMNQIEKSWGFKFESSTKKSEIGFVKIEELKFSSLEFEKELNLSEHYKNGPSGESKKLIVAHSLFVERMFLSLHKAFGNPTSRTQLKLHGMSFTVDKGWMKCPCKSAQYIEGVRSFIEFVNRNGGGNTLFSCPCSRCKNCKGLGPLSEISLHLLKYGILYTYTTWRFHGEKLEVAARSHVDNTSNGDVAENVENINPGIGEGENLGDVVEDDGTAVVDYNIRIDSGVHNDAGTRKMKKKEFVYERAKEPLYPSCRKGVTALYASIKLNHIKIQYGFSDNGMTALLELMKELLPEENTLPSKYAEVEKMIQELGMDYITYDACVNDRVLYWKDHASLVKCPVCQESRYKKVFNDERKLTTVVQKTVRHFSLITRLKRFYNEPWIAEAMTWHSRAKSDINIMRHPIDSSAWRCADSFSPEFSKEPRNVTLGISTDDFNPNGCFGLARCWPVIICIYNLPSSLYMKPEFSLLSLLVSGPKAPSKNFDVYLEILVDELKKLWDGVLAFDAFSKTEFLMRSWLLWGIHDFLALGTLAGYVTHGYCVCPTCGEDTVADYLPFTKKICYRGHRRWLPSKHKYRDDMTNFDGHVEHGTAPWPLTGLQIQEIVGKLSSKKGKRKQPSQASLKRKRKADTNKELEDDGNVEDEGSNVIRHIIDVMHTKKNIMEHLLNTMMGNNKSKDSPAARQDMEDMGIRKKLWLKEDAETGRTTMEKGSFEMTKKEKIDFCKVLKNMRVPFGFSSNLRNCVSVNPPELRNFKSHDYHVVMQHFLPLLVHTATSLPKELRVSLLRISIFFNILCTKVVNREHLLKAKASLVEAICVLEKHFPPSFFVISIHLMIHLADEALNSGPVRFRWMYPFERLMKGFKGLVRNKRYIDGCITRGYTL
ncbi:uncharacterized protein LOC113355176 [Papaver somniferum]|uniref:uncharacterized protein LOC113355176 n=1 Tax=Papaver somniferum TaxID=3469 RepID=UPI000E6F9250|nr:uncharacterized protein LOC113355176 [Papaver somniferum]